MTSLNKRAISEFLQTHSNDGLNAIVHHIIQTTKCAANCQNLTDRPKYSEILAAAQKRGTLTSPHQTILQQVEALGKLECHKSSLRVSR